MGVPRAEKQRRRRTAARRGADGCGRSLVREAVSHQAAVVVREDADDLLGKVVPAGGRRLAVALVVGGPALVDVFTQALVDILVLASLTDLGLVVELDLVHQELGEAARLLVDFL